MGEVVTLNRESFGGDRLQDFSASEDRARLSAVALKAFVRVIDAWDLNNADAAALLGVSDSSWDRIKSARWKGNLSQDQLTRASGMIGIFKGLHLLFADGMADRWPLLDNRAPLFGGRSPANAMIHGGIPQMLETRQYVDALRGGF